MEVKIHIGNRMERSHTWSTSSSRRKCTSRCSLTFDKLNTAIWSCKHEVLYNHVQELALYLDYRLDESYTPKHISVRAGNSFTDMTEIHTQELDEPHGWTRIPLLTQNVFQGVSVASCF